MNTEEKLFRAKALADEFVWSLEEAHQSANSIDRPEGRSIGDRALIAFLGEAIAKAHKLRAKLNRV